MVFIECLRKPIKKEQLDNIKVDTLESKCMDYIYSRAQGLLQNRPDKPKGGHRSQPNLSYNLTKTLERELIWARAKNVANTPLNNTERVSQFDLLNFQRTINTDHQENFKRKRDQKAEAKQTKQVFKVAQTLPMNTLSETPRLFESLSKEEEVYYRVKEEGGCHELKQSPIIPLN